MSEETDKNEIWWTETKMPMEILAAVLLCVQRRDKSLLSESENRALDEWTKVIHVE